jgi:hypothetical protein
MPVGDLVLKSRHTKAQEKKEKGFKMELLIQVHLYCIVLYQDVILWFPPPDYHAIS